MKRISIALAALALSTFGAQAVTLEITSVTGVWTATTGTPFNLTGLNTDEIRWGDPANVDQSGYLFEGAAPPTVSFSPGDVFDLGDFTHFNETITGGTITSATLEVTFVGTANNGGSVPINLTSTYLFNHFETTNSANPCADGGANGVGVNVNGCADQVTPVLNVALSDTIILNGLEYLFAISGFDIGSTFWTIEGETNVATLQGLFILKSQAVIPLPAALPLYGTGLAVVGFIGWRRKRKAAA